MSRLSQCLLFATLVCFSTQNCQRGRMSHIWCRRASFICIIYIHRIDNLDATSQQNWCHLLCFHVSTTAMLFSQVYLSRHWHHCKQSSMRQQESCSTSYHTTMWLLLCGSCIVVYRFLLQRVSTTHCLLVHKTLLGHMPAYIVDLLTSAAYISACVHQLTATLSYHEQAAGLVTELFLSLYHVRGKDFQQNLTCYAALQHLGVNLRRFSVIIRSTRGL